ncbi:MAG: hypothetical protein R2784_10015 [Saprospiraceae bacterium]
MASLKIASKNINRKSGIKTTLKRLSIFKRRERIAIKKKARANIPGMPSSMYVPNKVEWASKGSICFG